MIIDRNAYRKLLPHLDNLPKAALAEMLEQGWVSSPELESFGYDRMSKVTSDLKKSKFSRIEICYLSSFVVIARFAVVAENA